MPPNSASLEQPIRRANYITKVWKTADTAKQELPKPWDGHGWLSTGEPLWCSEVMILPESLIDILDTTSNEESDEDNDEVVSDGEEVTNMLDDSDDSDTD